MLEADFYHADQLLPRSDEDLVSKASCHVTQVGLLAIITMLIDSVTFLRNDVIKQVTQRRVRFGLHAAERVRMLLFVCIALH